MNAKFSPRVQDVIQFSREEAIRLGHDYIGPEHLLLGLIREGVGKAMKAFSPQFLLVSSHTNGGTRPVLLLSSAWVPPPLYP